MTEELAVYGPPWRTVASSRDVLFADPPGPLGCASHLALAAFSPYLGELVRELSAEAVEKRARELAKAGDGVAFVLQGVIQTRSGAWLWPIAVDRIAVAKAPPNPLTRTGFAVAVEQLQQGLVSVATPAEREAVRQALATLGRRPWPAMSAAELNEAIDGVAELVAEIPSDAAYVAEATATLEAAAMATGAASLVAGGPGVSRTLSVGAEAIARRIGRDGLTFVTNEYRHRGAMWSRDARAIISSGVREGLGRVDIGRDLTAALRDRVSGRSEWYYRVVASATTSRSRSFGSLSGYREAGFQYYQWEAFLDGRTCQICQFLHGQVFAVEPQLARYARASANPDPEAGVNEFPWYRVVGGTTSPEGLRVGGTIYVSPRGEGPTTPVAVVRESAAGRNDERGTFRELTSVREAGGTMVPPAHGLCRCTTIPV